MFTPKETGNGKVNLMQPKMVKVETYRLWPDGSWDKVEVEIMAEPWTMEIVESRAVTVAWKQLIAEEVKPLQIGLYMPSIKEPLT